MNFIISLASFQMTLSDADVSPEFFIKKTRAQRESTYVGAQKTL